MDQNKLESHLKEIFGFERFRDRQKEIITHLLGGNHGLVIMPTGFGKSLLYQFTGCLLSKLTLVLSPLIALMKDQVDKLTQFGIQASFINSSLHSKEREERYRNLKNNHYQILYITPERFR